MFSKISKVVNLTKTQIFYKCNSIPVALNQNRLGLICANGLFLLIILSSLFKAFLVLILVYSPISMMLSNILFAIFTTQFHKTKKILLILFQTIPSPSALIWALYNWILATHNYNPNRKIYSLKSKTELLLFLKIGMFKFQGKAHHINRSQILKFICSLTRLDIVNNGVFKLKRSCLFLLTVILWNYSKGTCNPIELPMVLSYRRTNVFGHRFWFFSNIQMILFLPDKLLLTACGVLEVLCTTNTNFLVVTYQEGI